MGISAKRWRTTTVSQFEDAYPVAAVQREWDSRALNQVWVGDHLPEDLGRVALLGHRHRRALAPRDRLGHRRLHAHVNADREQDH